MGLSQKSNYEKKNSFLVLTSGKFLEALGRGIGTGSIFCLSFSLSNRVSCDHNNNHLAEPRSRISTNFLHSNFLVNVQWGNSCSELGSELTNLQWLHYCPSELASKKVWDRLNLYCIHTYKLDFEQLSQFWFKILAH